MTMTPVFNAAETPLTRGTTLIEASAGTGKTYTITAIFLRLLLEGGLEVSQILVTTYTEAATAELRDRIRSRLTSALDGFQTMSSKDPLVSELVREVDSQPASDLLGTVVLLQTILHLVPESGVGGQLGLF